VVICIVLVVATAQIGTETTELEAQFASSDPRTPLSEAIAALAPPKGLAERLANSLVNDPGDELRESADIDHSWADNDAWLGITHLRRKLVSSIKSMSSNPGKDEPSARPQRDESSVSLEVGESVGVSPMSGLGEGPEPEISKALSELLPAGYSFDTDIDLDDNSFEQENDSQVLLQLQSPPSKVTVFDLKLSAKESLRMAEITGNANELQKGETEERKADIAQARVQAMRHRTRIVQMETSGEQAQLQVEVEKRTLKRRVEGRMQSEHLEQLRQSANDAKKTAYDTQIRAAHEMELWVHNQPGVNRASVDREDGISKFSAQKARQLDEAYKIAKADAKKNPMYGDSDCAKSNQTSNITSGTNIPLKNVPHHVIAGAEEKAVQKAQKALSYALLTDDGYKSALTVAKIADAYIKTSKQAIAHHFETATDDVVKAKTVAGLALDEAILHNTRAHLQKLKDAFLQYKSLEAKVEEAHQHMKDDSVAVPEHEKALEDKDNAESLEKKANKSAQKAYKEAAESGRLADMAHAQELGEQWKMRERNAQSALKKADSVEIVVLRRKALNAEAHAAASLTKSNGAKRDANNAAHRILSAKHQREKLAMDQTKLVVQIVELQKKLADAGATKRLMTKQDHQAQEDEYNQDVKLKVAKMNLGQTSELVKATTMRKMELERQLESALEDYKQLEANVTQAAEKATPKPRSDGRTDRASMSNFFDDASKLQDTLQKKLTSKAAQKSPSSGQIQRSKKVTQIINELKDKQIYAANNVNEETEINNGVQAQVAKATKILHTTKRSGRSNDVPKKKTTTHVSMMKLNEAKQIVTQLDNEINETNKLHAQQEKMHGIPTDILSATQPFSRRKEYSESAPRPRGSSSAPPSQTGAEAEEDLKRITSKLTNATAEKSSEAKVQHDLQNMKQEVEELENKETVEKAERADDTLVRVKAQLRGEEDKLFQHEKRQVRFQSMLRLATDQAKQLRQQRETFEDKLRNLSTQTGATQKELKTRQDKESSTNEKIHIVDGVIKIAQDYAHDAKKMWKTLSHQTQKAIQNSKQVKRNLRTTVKVLKERESKKNV